MVREVVIPWTGEVVDWESLFPEQVCEACFEDYDSCKCEEDQD